MSIEQRVAEILGDWYERCDRGEPIPPEDVISAHPDLAAELRTRFAALEFIDAALERGPLADPSVPAQIGDYRIRREVGRGGMGVVFEAEQVSMGRTVALKVLSPAITNSPQSIQRFRREARAAGRVHHTNVAPVYGMGQHEGHWYYAMELVEGQTLGAVIVDLRRAKCDLAPQDDSITNSTMGTDTTHPDFFRHVAQLFAGVAYGLHAAHEEGVIHRDIKPSNLILTADGQIKIVDFGLARLENDGPTMTLTGNVIGTPAYMSPEQTGRGGRRVDARTDTYSLAATLYELLTLEKPFEANSWQELYAKITTAEPDLPRRRNPHLPRDLETVVLKAMEKDPDRRYATTEDFARDLERFAEGLPIAARAIGPLGRGWRKIKRHRIRSGLVAAVAAVGIVAVALGWTAREEAHKREDLEYAALLQQGKQALAASVSGSLQSESRAIPTSASQARRAGPMSMHGDEETLAYDLLSRAIALNAERPEAFWLRALAVGRPLAERLQDLVQARVLGLDKGAADLTGEWMRARAGQLPPERIQTLHKVPPQPKTPLEAVFVAYFHYVAGSAEKALASLAEANRMPSSDAASRYLATRLGAWIKERQGDYPNALHDLYAVLGMGHDYPVICMSISRVWKRKGDPAAAEGSFEEAVTWARERGTHAAWRRLLRATARQVVSREWFERAAQAASAVFPDEPVFLAYHADARSLTGDNAGAKRLIALAEARAPQDRTVLHARAWILQRGGDFDGALETLRRLGSDDHSTNERIGMILTQTGRAEQGIPYLEAACEQSPICMQSLKALAIAYGQVGRTREGRALLDRVVSMAPGSAAGIAARGAYRQNREGDAVGARKDFEAALRWDPTFALAHYDLGILDRNAEEHEAACTHFEKARDLDPLESTHHTALVEELLLLKRTDLAATAADEAIEHLRDSPTGYLLRCDVQLVLGNTDAARTAVRAAEAAAAGGHQALSGIGKRLARLGFLKEAETHMRLGLKSSETSDQWNQLGLVLKDQKDWQGAKQSFERAIQLNAENPSAHRNLGLLLQRQGDLDGALRCFNEAFRHEKYSADGRAKVQGLRARLLFKLKRVDEARAGYEAALVSAPEAPMYVSRGAFRHDQLRDAERALQDFRRAIEIDPLELKAYLFKGIAHRTLRQPKKAIEAWQDVIRLDSGHVWARRMRGDLLMELGDLDEAVKEYRAARSLRPTDPKFMIREGHALSKMGQWQLAADALEDALALRPKHPAATNALALCRQQLGDSEGALAGYASAAQLAPRWAAPHWMRGLLLQDLDQVPQAREAFLAAIQSDPGWIAAYNDLGVLHLHRGEHEQAHAWLTTAIEKNDRYTVAYVNRVRVLQCLHRFDEALKDTKVLLTLAPNEAGTYSDHANVLWNLGQHRAALVAFAKADELDSESSRAIRDSVDVLLELGDYEVALSLIQTAERRFEGELQVRALYLSVLLGLTRADEARRLATTWAKELPSDGGVPSALILAAAGDQAGARQALEAFPGQDDDHRHHGRAIAFAALGDLKALKAELTTALELGLWLPPGAKLVPALLQHEGRDADLDQLYENLRKAKAPPAR